MNPDKIRNVLNILFMILALAAIITYHFGYELVYHAVTATRAVVHGIIVHQSRFLVNQILGFDYFFFSHNFFSLSVGEPYKKLH